MAVDWISEQVVLFNASKKDIDGYIVQIRVSEQDSIDIWQGNKSWSPQNHPVAWIPEGVFSVDYVTQQGSHFEPLIPSIASTSLVWGIFEDRFEVLRKIDWKILQDATMKQSWENLGGQPNWVFVKPAFALPYRSMAGLSVVLLASAEYHQTSLLTPQHLSDRGFQNWFSPVLNAVPNFVSLGQKPAEIISKNGASIADFALLPESEWLVYYKAISRKQAIRFIYPTYRLIFDMPLVIWSEASSREKSAVRLLGEFLMQESVQMKAVERYGLRSATIPVANSPLFVDASMVGISMQDPPGIPLILPKHTGVLNMLSWLKSERPS